MRVKAIRDLLQITDTDFFLQIAEGLELIINNARRIYDGCRILTEARNYQASRFIAVLSEEEASKFLILLDAVRCPRQKNDKLSAQLNRFNDHLAKGLYAMACYLKPPTLKDLQSYLDHYRQEFYLDGPNDIDWIFYNEILLQREAVQYVDYVSTDDGHYWSDPGQYEDLSLDPMKPHSLRIAESLFKIGAATSGGLKVIADIWRNLIFEPSNVRLEKCILGQDKK